MSWLHEHPAGGFFIFIILFILTTRKCFSFIFFVFFNAPLIYYRQTYLTFCCAPTIPFRLRRTSLSSITASKVVFIPPSILTLGSGVAFAKAFGLGPGIVLASSASFVGACVGAVIAFFRARYLMRDLIKLFANRYPIVKATDRAIKHKGFRIYLLLRMCPVIPFNALNYIGGITGVKWTAYTCALIGILPWQIVLVFIGATVGSVNDMREEDQNSYNKVSIIIGCVFSSLSVIIMWYYARKELRKEIAAHEEDIANEEAASRGEDVEAQDVSDRFSLAPSASDTADDEFSEEGEDEAWYWIWV